MDVQSVFDGELVMVELGKKHRVPLQLWGPSLEGLMYYVGPRPRPSPLSLIGTRGSRRVSARLPTYVLTLVAFLQFEILETKGAEEGLDSRLDSY